MSAAWIESHLANNSYLAGYEPTQADVAVFKSLKEAPSTPHAARWYKHIQTYETEFPSLPGDAAKSADSYAPSTSAAVPVAASKAPVAAADDDDEVDLFGSDDDEVDEEAEKLKQQRLAEYEKKKAGKVKPAAKSVVTLDVKPWDDETDMKALEASVRSIELDGLVWGLSKLVPVGYGVNKLQINLVIEDDKISLDDLQEQIAEFEDYVQSSDIQAMQKL